MHGVVFDMDGVLVDSSGPHLESWRRMAREIGQDMPEEAFRRTFGQQNRTIIPQVFGVQGRDEVERLSERKEEIYRELIRGSVPAMDGAAALVRACRDAGLGIAIGSSGPPENVDIVLRGMEIDDCFDARITAREVTRGKPDPQVFLLAARHLGLEPGRCAVIEDAPHGVDAALAAGAAAIALVGDYALPSLEHADLVVASLRELTPEIIVKAIESRRAGPS